MPVPDVASPGVLLQMLKHGRAGIPMEVMGLMLGEFVDDYSVRVIDVFAMPQSGTVSCLALDRSQGTFNSSVCRVSVLKL